MPKFKLCITQMVESITTIVIEAADKEAAQAEARRVEDRLRTQPFDGDHVWIEGGEATDPEVYAVLNARGDVVWER
jgi:hypothetical protein